MSNMSYCRFQNTLPDLRDCFDNMCDDLSDREFRARKELIKLCHEIADAYDADDFTECCPDCELSLDACNCDEED